ncbi:MAG: hypothetical protein GY851_29145 [bacterium]|nr:hypothetical protein [bacterium]
MRSWAPAFALPMFALVQRDFVRSLRRWRPFLIMLGLTFLVAWNIMDEWPQDTTTVRRVLSGTESILALWCFWLMSVLGLFIPAFGAASIAGEREGNTFEALSMTLITPWGLVLGKLVSLLGFYVLLLIACAPFLATLFFLMGFDVGLFLMMFAVLAVTAFVCAAASILCSAIARRVAPAAILSMLCAAWIMGAPFVLLYVADDVFGFRVTEKVILEYGPIFSPVGTMLSAGMGFLSQLELVLALGYHTLCGACALCVARYLVGRAVEPEVQEGGRPRTLRQWFRRGVFGGMPKRVAIADAVNPVYAAESRYSLLTRGPMQWRMASVSFLVFVAVIAWLAGIGLRPRRGEEFAAFYVGVALVAICVTSVGLVANSITGERGRGNLDMLRASLLSPGTIVWGKARAGLVTVACLIVGAVLPFLLNDIYSPLEFRYQLAVYQGFITLAVCCLLCVAAAMVASVLAKRTTTAIIGSYLMAAFASAGIMTLFLLLLELIRPSPDWWGQGDPSPRIIVAHVVGWTSPPGAYFLSVFSDEQRFSTFWITSMMAATLTSVGLLWLAARAFVWRANRDS